MLIVFSNELAASLQGSKAIQMCSHVRKLNVKISVTLFMGFKTFAYATVRSLQNSPPPIK